MPVNKTTIQIADMYGVAPSNKACADMLREALERYTAEQDAVIELDFSRVLILGIVFADIVLCDYALKHGLREYNERILIVNASKSVQKTIDRAFSWYNLEKEAK